MRIPDLQTLGFFQAFATGDTGLVDMAYYALLELECCSLAEIDLESVSLDLLCYLLKRNETTLSEEEIYTLSLRYDGGQKPSTTLRSQKDHLSKF